MGRELIAHPDEAGEASCLVAVNLTVVGGDAADYRIDVMDHLEQRSDDVTEEQWLACTDPTAILEYLRSSGTISGRGGLGAGPAAENLTLWRTTAAVRRPHARDADLPGYDQ